MEGHDYSLAVSDENKLIRVDIASDNYESDPYSIRDAINIVSEWNAELIDYYHRRWELEDDINEAKYLKLKLSALKNDECILDKLYA